MIAFVQNSLRCYQTAIKFSVLIKNYSLQRHKQRYWQLFEKIPFRNVHNCVINRRKSRPSFHSILRLQKNHSFCTNKVINVCRRLSVRVWEPGKPFAKLIKSECEHRFQWIWNYTMMYHIKYKSNVSTIMRLFEFERFNEWNKQKVFVRLADNASGLLSIAFVVYCFCFWLEHYFDDDDWMCGKEADTSHIISSESIVTVSTLFFFYFLRHVAHDLIA